MSVKSKYKRIIEEKYAKVLVDPPKKTKLRKRFMGITIAQWIFAAIMVCGIQYAAQSNGVESYGLWAFSTPIWVVAFLFFGWQDNKEKKYRFYLEAKEYEANGMD